MKTPLFGFIKWNTLFLLTLGLLGTASVHAQLYVASDTGVIATYTTSGGSVNSSFISTIQPYGLTLNAGTLFVATLPTQNTINSYNATTGAAISVPLQSWGASVIDVAYYNGNIYAAYYADSKVGKYSATVPQGSPNHNFITGITFDAGIFIDNSGVLYVTSRTNGTLGTYNATTGAAINASLITGLTNPWGVAVDASGNIYVTSDQSGTNGYIGKYASNGTAINDHFITGLNRPLYLALDGGGNLYETNYGAGAGTGGVGKFNTTTGSGGVLISGLTTPTGIAVIAAVPEPSSIAFFGIGALALMSHRVRKSLRQRKRL